MVARVKRAEIEEIKRSATISTCQQFRYCLSRVWDETSPQCMFIGLNPSTADHRQDDATIRRCVGFARGFQFGGFKMLNIYAFRTRHPSLLAQAKDPVGPLNITAILSAAKDCGTCVVAWGCLKKELRRSLDYDRRVLAMLSLILTTGHPAVYCLGTTSEGFPRHPLFVRGDTPLQVYTNSRLESHREAVELRRRRQRRG